MFKLLLDVFAYGPLAVLYVFITFKLIKHLRTTDRIPPLMTGIGVTYAILWLVAVPWLLYGFVQMLGIVSAILFNAGIGGLTATVWVAEKKNRIGLAVALFAISALALATGIALSIIYPVQP